jgi:hypothetical protein
VLANELLLRETLKTVPSVKGRLLDIGCGEKPYLDIFSPHTVSYTGIDIPQSLHKKIDFICKYIHIQLSTGILGKIIPATLKKLIVTLPQILYLKLFKNTDVNILFSLGNILVAVK